jgi:hypothetical protein
MKKQLTENALKVARSRYFMGNTDEWKNGADWVGEDWEACARRVATTIAEPETTNKQKTLDAFEEMIANMDFLPGGRILRNCGRAKGSLFNCYHLPIGDNIEEIGTLIKDSLILWSEGGGVGCNFSPLRPKGDPILGKGGKSSGLVSFIEATDAVAKTIESGGGRRAAIIGHVDVSHPEIMDFIDAKLVHNMLPRINISVVVNNEFLECVEANRDWEFKFKQKSYGKIRARDLWEKIVTNMIKCAEPHINRIRKIVGDIPNADTEEKLNALLNELCHIADRYDALVTYKMATKKNSKDLQSALARERRKKEEVETSLKFYQEMALRRAEEIERLRRNMCRLCHETEKERKSKMLRANRQVTVNVKEFTEFLKNQRELPPEFAQIVEDHFWDLLA